MKYFVIVVFENARSEMFPVNSADNAIIARNDFLESNPFVEKAAVFTLFPNGDTKRADWNYPS